MLAAARIRLLARLFVVALLACSWLAVSNHCALAALHATQSNESSEIHCAMSGMTKPGSQKKPDGPQSMECCKSLRAIPAKSLKAAAPLLTQVLPFAFVVGLLDLRSPSTTASGILGTGPPPAASFSDLVLQRSILAHAPPLFA